MTSIDPKSAVETPTESWWSKYETSATSADAPSKPTIAAAPPCETPSTTNTSASETRARLARCGFYALPNANQPTPAQPSAGTETKPSHQTGRWERWRNLAMRQIATLARHTLEELTTERKIITDAIEQTTAYLLPDAAKPAAAPAAPITPGRLEVVRDGKEKSHVFHLRDSLTGEALPDSVSREFVPKPGSDTLAITSPLAAAYASGEREFVRLPDGYHLVHDGEVEPQVAYEPSQYSRGPWHEWSFSSHQVVDELGHKAVHHPGRFVADAGATVIDLAQGLATHVWNNCVDPIGTWGGKYIHAKSGAIKVWRQPAEVTAHQIGLATPEIALTLATIATTGLTSSTLTTEAVGLSDHAAWQLTKIGGKALAPKLAIEGSPWLHDTMTALRPWVAPAPLGVLTMSAHSESSPQASPTESSTSTSPATNTRPTPYDVEQLTRCEGGNAVLREMRNGIQAVLDKQQDSYVRQVLTTKEIPDQALRKRTLKAFDDGVALEKVLTGLPTPFKQLRAWPQTSRYSASAINEHNRLLTATQKARLALVKDARSELLATMRRANEHHKTVYPPAGSTPRTVKPKYWQVPGKPKN